MMIKHVVMWKIDESYSPQQKEEIMQTFKTKLEALRELMEGVVQIDVIITPTPSSNVDMMLDSTFASQAILDAYQVHPKHVEVSGYLKGKVVARSCMDYEWE